MPRFSYIAIDHKGKTAKGTVNAENAYAARKYLRSRGLHPTDIKELSSLAGAATMKLSFQKNIRKQVAEFTRELSAMLSSGIKLTEALAVLTQLVTDAHFRNAINEIRERVLTGESLADCMAEYDRYFDIIYVSMVRVGQATGTLPETLATIAKFMHKRLRLESKLTTAMIYPAVLICAAIGVSIFLTIKVIPPIAQQIEKSGQALPRLTRVLMGISNILTSYWVFAIIGAIAFIIFAVRKFISTEKGARLKDRFLLSLPIIGPVLKQQIVARFASTLSVLLGAGLSMADSLRVVAEVTGNTIMYDAIKQARQRILSGADIATPLRDSGVLDPEIAHMVAVGEKTGELEQMLKNISENLEENSDVVIERLSMIAEPLIIILVAFLVGMIAIGALLPIIKYSAGNL